MRQLTVESLGYNFTHDLTDHIAAALHDVSAPDGLYSVFVQGSTVGLVVMRYEPGAVEDLLRALDRIAPDNSRYVHELTTRDPNGFSHIKSSVLGTSLAVPWMNGALAMSEKHRVVLVDFDLAPARRTILIDTKENQRA